MLRPPAGSTSTSTPAMSRRATSRCGTPAAAGTGFGPVRPPERLTVTLDVNLGGALIEYEDEDPEIRRRYEAALRDAGVPCQMPAELYEKGSAIRRPDLIPQE